ncbi:MAG: 50S ribosomal protein L6 [Deltaproteobacteria bacterium]|nr:50S ribosomal protein L6 [Deltaproteobacteria bacterium]MBK8241462.1 50S ribosomal protein L6 [Deltaproteobacteria bacterium]MBK8717174.1 50S ribosomal protein L6 [Deltaproteobacteria bacterium]MBP7286302.1 50S ribosomal protein L6 [Nannocystaceae bacterium]
MSRIGNAPVTVPKGVTLTTAGRTVSAKGPKGQLSFEMPDGVTMEHKGDQLTFTRAANDSRHRAMHGMVRARLANMIAGVGTGFTRELEIIGVGYRAAVKGQSVELTLGFSHGVNYPLPDGVKAEVTKDNKLILSGCDRVVLGQVASDIRDFRPPEPYKGKGVKYAEETIIRKEGKRGKK